MSCNYAEGLSPYLHKGNLGLPEIPDAPDSVAEKVSTLVTWLKESKHTVVYTGAGCSTAAGIPDFRGPNGVWTLERKGLKPDVSVSFDLAVPTMGHMILKSLLDIGHVKYIITQNIDGLHLRSGVKRTQLSELHGNMFVARCSYCERYIALRKSLPTVGQKDIGLNCPILKPGGRACRGKLHDTLLDWEDSLPEGELQAAEIHSKLADLSICLGTTLQIVPAGNLPLAARKNPGGKLVIVNLQATKHDKKADLIIRDKIDCVMEAVVRLLKIDVPSYTATMDPTTTLTNYYDWTVPGAYINSLKGLLAQHKQLSITTKKTKRKVNSEETESGAVDMDGSTCPKTQKRSFPEDDTN